MTQGSFGLGLREEGTGWGAEEEERKGGRELKARGAREGQKKMKRGSGETIRSAVDNYSRKLAEGTRERDRQRDKLIIIIFSMLVVITIIIMAINITVATVTATGKNWRAPSSLDQWDSANCSVGGQVFKWRVCICLWRDEKLKKMWMTNDINVGIRCAEYRFVISQQPSEWKRRVKNCK